MRDVMRLAPGAFDSQIVPSHALHTVRVSRPLSISGGARTIANGQQTMETRYLDVLGDLQAT